MLKGQNYTFEEEEQPVVDQMVLMACQFLNSSLHMKDS
jgi:hypothetical protein